jgi:hypothetical protein
MEVQGDTHRFKAWDFQNNIMVYDYSVISNIVKSQIKFIPSSDSIIAAIMPFTGVYDRDGKEIYRDDKVRVYLTPEYYFDSLVYWDKGAYYLIESYDKFTVEETFYFHTFSYDDKNRVMNFEVVGNKYVTKDKEKL